MADQFEVGKLGFFETEAGVTAHGDLTGLGNDDHTQYSLADGTRAYTGAVTINDDLTISGNMELTGGGNIVSDNGSISVLPGGTYGSTVTADGKATVSAVLDDATGDEVAWTFNYETDKSGSGNDTGLKIDFTNTDSPGTSYLIAGHTGVNRIFSISETGILYLRSNAMVSGFLGVQSYIRNYSANTDLKLNSTTTYGNTNIDTVHNSHGLLVGDSTAVGSLLNCTSNGTTTIAKVGHGLVGTAAAGDLIHITDATTAADEGYYRLVSLTVDTLVVDRALAGSDANVDLKIYKDVVLFTATDGTNGQRIVGCSHQDKPLQIGGDVLAATGHSLGAEDTLIGGKLEVDGIAYFDNASGIICAGAISLTGANTFYLGGTADITQAWMRIRSSNLLFGLGANVERNLLLVDGSHNGKDFDHAVSINPTLIIHSALDPDTNNTRYGSIHHDGTETLSGDMTFTTGAGGFDFNPDSGEVFMDELSYYSSSVTTADATPTTVAALTLSDERVHQIVARVVGVESDGSDRNSYHIEGLFYRTAGAGAVKEGATTSISTIESEGSCACDFDVIGDDVEVVVTGIGAEDWRWKCVLTDLNHSSPV